MGERTGRFGRSDRLRDSRDFRRVSRRARRSASRDFVILIAPRVSLDETKTRDDRGVEAQIRGSDDSRSEPGSRDENTVSEMAQRSRLGITVSRKVGNAVVRNRVKRAVREWYRHNRAKIALGIDIVVIARRSAARLDQSAIEVALDDLVYAAAR